MELNALTRWESIGKDLYQSGTVGRDIKSLKARSKHIDKARTERRQQRSEVEETIESDAGTPTASRVQLSDLEREEAAILAKWRALKEKGKKLRLEEDKLEQEVLNDGPSIPSKFYTPDNFPAGHEKWVYFSYRCLRRFAKGFLFGFSGKFAFAFVGLCLRHKFNLPRLLPDLFQALLKPEQFRYGCFLGSFLMVFESSIRLLRMKGWITRQTVRRHHRSIRVILSAIIAGTTAIAFLPKNVRLGISMFFLVRALEILVRYMVEEQEKTYVGITIKEKDKNVLITTTENGDQKLIMSSSTLAPRLTGGGGDDDDDDTPSSSSPLVAGLKRLRKSLKSFIVRLSKIPASDHFDTLVMATASACVIWAWLFNRSTVEPGYLHFLDYHGGRNRHVQFGYVELHTPGGIAPKTLDQINALRSAEGRPNLDLSLPLPRLMCSVLHRETESCTLAVWDFFKKAYLRALPVYLPVYLLPMIIFKHRQLLHRPLQILLPTVSNLLRSSLFLASYCTSAWAAACATTQVGLVTSIKGALAGFVGGSCVAMEKKGRRVELALYVLSQSLPSTYRTLHQWGYLPMIPHGESICFVAAMSVIMWSYCTRPHLMRSSYLSLFKFFFGSGGRSAGFSTRAVEHSDAAPNHLLKPAIDELKTSQPILSPDPMEPEAVANPTLKLDSGANVAAGVGSAIDLPHAHHPIGRHISRLSTVEDVDHSESEMSDTSTVTRKTLKPREQKNSNNTSQSQDNDDHKSTASE